MTILPFALLVSLALSTAPLTDGANCTLGSCEAEEECPPDSKPAGGEGGGCTCAFEHCSGPPVCHYDTRLRLVKKASKVPGDCCDINECEPITEVNCTGVVCNEEQEACPEDSLELPKLVVGPCCAQALGCACQPGPCPPPPQCPRGSPRLVRPGDRRPGTCCSLYSCPNATAPKDLGKKKRACEKEPGSVVEEGESWSDGCRRCVCRGGVAVCASPPCPPLPPNCTEWATLPGDCCPTCTYQQGGPPGGCKSGSGMIHENGATWDEDDCTRCTCVGGAAKCQAAMCPVDCPNATYVKGECCPRCPNGTHVVTVPPNCPPLTNCPIRCKNGNLRDRSNCFTCQCKEECQLECPGGYKRDSDGNELCECRPLEGCPSIQGCRKKCRHGFRWDPLTGCPQCKCHHCKQLAQCSKRCPHGLALDSRNCPTCKCKPSNITISNNTSNETGGYCVTGEGERKDDGEVWFDGCRECYCLGGREMCALVSCPRLPCPEPLLQRGACCPTCPGNDSVAAASSVVCYSPGGGVRREGELWQLGECVECVCHGGRVLCRGVGGPCPPALCTRPTRRGCCPSCQPQPPTTPSHQLGCGEGRGPGATWKDGPCISCICQDGVASCYTETCLTDTTCSTPVQVKDQCCPLCFESEPGDRDSGSESEETCQVGNVTFSVGDEWEPKECTRCTCSSGRTVTCTQAICPDPPCPNCGGAGSSEGDKSDVGSTSKSGWWSDYVAPLLALGSFVVIGVILAAVYKIFYDKRHRKLSLNPPRPPGRYECVRPCPTPPET